MKINHIISLGTNCDCLYFLKSLKNNIRVPGPVDNCLATSYCISRLLDGTFLNDIINEDVTYENEGNTILNNSKFNIQHNDFRKLKYKISLRERLLNLFQYIYKSQFDDSLWFIISISPFEKNVNVLYNEIIKLPTYIKSKLILLQGRECEGGLIDNVNEYPVFNIYKLFNDSYKNEETLEWCQMNSADLVNLFNSFLKDNIYFYSKLNNSNWNTLEIKINKET
jgi:hypothetical protein